MSAAHSELKVAVVGAGHLGRIHARIYQESDAQLIAVVDPDSAAREAVAEVIDCPTYASLDDLEQVPDAVSVVVPTHLHAKVSIPLLERGIPCLVEKPLASSVAEAEAILAAADRGGALLTVGHVERFQPGLRKVREMKLAPKFIECHRLAPFSFRSMDVGVVHDLMIHDLDLVLDMVDSPLASFDASGGSILTDHEDVASVRLIFESGARANVTASRVSMSPMRRFRTFSRDSYVSLDFTKNYGLVVQKGPEWDSGRRELSTLDPRELAERDDFVTGGMLEVTELELEGEERPLQAELASFLDSVASGSAPRVSGEDGLRALQLADRIAAAIREQSW